jgi:hypothetical protein
MVALGIRCRSLDCECIHGDLPPTQASFESGPPVKQQIVHGRTPNKRDFEEDIALRGIARRSGGHLVITRRSRSSPNQVRLGNEQTLPQMDFCTLSNRLAISRIDMKNRTWTRSKFTNGHGKVGRLIQMLICGLLCIGIVSHASAFPREQARRIHDRLAGVPPSEAVLQAMEADVAAGAAINAAYTAMDNPSFYNVTLKNFAMPWTNREQSVFAPLNDYVATVIGMIRDDVPFNTLLSADLIYVGTDPRLGSYTYSDNDHYASIERLNINMGNVNELVPTTQSSINGLPGNAASGVWTTRAAAEAFFIAGTNRAQFRFTMLNHLCNDMEQVHDVKPAPDRIRQDVSRSPGGDSRLFLNNCIGCHSGMDPLAGAFAYYNFNEMSGRLEYTPNVVQPKYFNNDTNFEPGYRTTDDSWMNYWRQGQNQFLGWSPLTASSGNGAQSMGDELANSDAFASCQVKKVFKAVCLRSPENAADRTQVAQMVASLKAGYRMKQTFAEAAVYCMGQ